MEGTIVVFDFDKTIIDIDSDNWVVDELGFTDLFNLLLPTMPWNSLMDRMMAEMHEQGVTIHDIAEVLYRVPIHPRVVPTIKSAYSAGCELRVVSDANQFFIETILDNLGIRGCFSEINTNPSYIDEEQQTGGGRLRIKPFATSPHGCNGVCPPNMCKGVVIDRILSQNPEKRIIYLGDGAGDYCPSLRLRQGYDVVMPRKNYPVWELIVAKPELIRAEIHEWNDGQDLETVLLALIETSTSPRSSVFNLSSSSSIASTDEDVEDQEEAVAQLLSVDHCKFGIPMASHETLPPALPVPH